MELVNSPLRFSWSFPTANCKLRLKRTEEGHLVVDFGLSLTGGGDETSSSYRG